MFFVLVFFFLVEGEEGGIFFKRICTFGQVKSYARYGRSRHPPTNQPTKVFEFVKLILHPCHGWLTEQSPQITITTTNEPNCYTSHETSKSRGSGAMSYESWQWSHDDRHFRAEDPDADGGQDSGRCPVIDRELPGSCAPSDGAGDCARGGPSHRVHRQPRRGCSRMPSPRRRRRSTRPIPCRAL